ncbi:hypothetical protein L596_020364 [Steinernema carpocapsae]|uniref:Uncharacterized protein n=1 Tax=Steinernema carpocapsae TaxID=34508 RepID=A0A4U5MTD4_STECR|nr:hypothetical protein L596_020364 [Steinernema carpocapsae]
MQSGMYRDLEIVCDSDLAQSLLPSVQESFLEFISNPHFERFECPRLFYVPFAFIEHAFNRWRAQTIFAVAKRNIVCCVKSTELRQFKTCLKETHWCRVPCLTNLVCGAF